MIRPVPLCPTTQVARLALFMLSVIASCDAEDAGRKIEDTPVNGFVLDGGGQPVEGATVVIGIFRDAKPQTQLVTTGAAGEFSTRFKYSDHPFLTAYKAGMAVGTYHIMELIKESGHVTLILNKPAPFVARIQDPQGRPVAGAKVRVNHFNLPKPNGERTYNNIMEQFVAGTVVDEGVYAESNAEGVVRCPAIPAGAECMVSITAPGMALFRSMSRREKSLYAGTEDKPAIIQLEPGARIEGRVVTKLPGVDVAGLNVLLQDSKDSGVIADPYRVQTDAEGRFRFDRLAAGTSNIFLVDHEPDGPWTYAAAQDTVTKAGEATQVVIELIEGHMVEGRVIDPVGKPIAEAYIGVYGPIRPRSGAAIIGYRTKADGQYRFHLPPGQAYIYMSGAAPGYIGRGRGNVQVPEGKGTIPGPDMTLNPTREVVLKLLQKNGEPANDVEIVRLSNSERWIDLKARPLRPQPDGSVVLLRDNPLGFATGGRLAMTLRKNDGTEQPITTQVPEGAELELTVP